nr:RNA-directed DNA polymerase, eukaryota [Tanacetum cinerariifolium]
MNGDGVFRAKEVRTILDDIFLPSAADAMRWVKYIPIKINVFAWRAQLDRLLTRSNLVRRGVVFDSSLCPLCGLVPEDIHHVLFRCDTTKLVFRRICRCVCMPKAVQPVLECLAYVGHGTSHCPASCKMEVKDKKKNVEMAQECNSSNGDSKEDGHSSDPSSRHRNTPKRPVDKDVYGTKLESNASISCHLETKSEKPQFNLKISPCVFCHSYKEIEGTGPLVTISVLCPREGSEG